MIASILLLAMMHSPCPITIGITKSGTIYTNRFHGWYKTSVKTLELNLRSGCYNDADPSPITSVRVAIAAGAPKPRVELVFGILKGDGWPREKVKVQPWLRSPRKPLKN